MPSIHLYRDSVLSSFCALFMEFKAFCGFPKRLKVIQISASSFASSFMVNSHSSGSELAFFCLLISDFSCRISSRICSNSFFPCPSGIYKSLTGSYMHHFFGPLPKVLPDPTSVPDHCRLLLLQYKQVQNLHKYFSPDSNYQ